jgi:hypothetical protein
MQPPTGDDIETFKSTYESMFIHEFSHIYGTLDFTGAGGYGYGYDAAKQIASDKLAGVVNPVNPNAEPGLNADSYGFFAIGSSSSLVEEFVAEVWAC